jgi:hypothetical protein
MDVLPVMIMIKNKVAKPTMTLIASKPQKKKLHPKFIPPFYISLDFKNPHVFF